MKSEVTAQCGSTLTLETKNQACQGHNLLTVAIGGHVEAAAVLTDNQLNALLRDRERNCGTCRFGRMDPDANLRCHKAGPRKRGTEVFFPRVDRTMWCGRYKPAGAGA